MRRNHACLLLLAFTLGTRIQAATIVVDPNPIVTTNGVIDSITGADMAGLIVTAQFAEPTGLVSIPMTWEATGPTSGAASSSSGGTPTVSVSLSGNTSGALAWTYNSIVLSPLVSLQFDGTAAGVYFDRTSPDPGTPGSGPGQDITFGPLLPAGIDSSITVTYSSAVAIDGNPPQNDLYARMLISFPNSVSGPANFPPQGFSFTQDTDHSVVPEPSSWLLALGASGLLAIAIRRHPHSGAQE